MPAGYKKLPLPGFSLMIASLLLGIVFFNCIHQPLLADPDIGWHLRDAQFLVQHHAFLRTDPYTFSLHGHAWIDPEWLSELFFYAAFRAAGITGLEILSILLIELMTIGICFLAWQRTRALRHAILAATLWILFASVSIAPRTQLFGWLCFIAELALLNHFREAKSGSRNLLWLLTPLFALWINLHGSWPIGLLFLLIFIGCGLKSFQRGAIESTAWTPQQRKRLLLAAAFIVPAIFLNPYTWQLVTYPFLIAGSHPITLNAVQEWQSLDLHGTRGRLVFGLVAILFTARALKPRTWNLYDVAALFLAVACGFTYSRFLLLTGIVLCPLLAEEAGFLGKDNPAIDKPWLNAAIVALVLTFMATHVPPPEELRLQSDRGYPTQAVDYLRQHPPAGPLFNDFNWGGYLLWNDPGLPIFIDTRADVFEQTGLLQDYVDLTKLRLPVEDFHQGEFRYVLFPKDSEIVAALSRSSNWTIEYQDATAVLLRRTR